MLTSLIVQMPAQADYGALQRSAKYRLHAKRARKVGTGGMPNHRWSISSDLCRNWSSSAWVIVFN